MPMSTYSPERLERNRQSTPPPFDEWCERHAFGPHHVAFLEKVADAHGSELIQELLFDSCTKADREAVQKKYLNLRDEMFENFWHELPMEAR